MLEAGVKQQQYNSPIYLQHKKTGGMFKKNKTDSIKSNTLEAY